MSTPFRVLIIDDEASQRESLAGFLRKHGYEAATAATGGEGLDALRRGRIDLVLTDLRMPDISGEEVLAATASINPSVPVIVMTAFASIESAVVLMKRGAFDYLQKPIELDELTLLLERARERSLLLSENAALREQLAQRFSTPAIVSQSSGMEHVLNIAGRVASSSASVLIRGESGTGKELVARAIHDASPRNDRPFIVVNCAALPETLFESELFGHERGAFTGAERLRIGKFEQADGGTLFIDEVGDIPPAVQVKLLRAVQFGAFERLGGTETRTPDVRIVAATNRNLEEMIAAGHFREDLFYRLNVVGIFIPPLRARKEDIPPLVDAFLAKHAAMNRRETPKVSREAMDMLMRYDYPGNVRELENIVQRAVVLLRGDTICSRDLPPTLQLDSELPLSDGSGIPVTPGDLVARIEQLERGMITNAMHATGGNQVRAAALLHISERALRYKLAKYDLK